MAQACMQRESMRLYTTEEQVQLVEPVTAVDPALTGQQQDVVVVEDIHRG